MLKNVLPVTVLSALAATCLMACADNPSSKSSQTQGAKAMTEKVVKTDEEWRKELSPETYRIARQKGTEPAFTGKYWDCHTQGVYRCACCGAELFDSETKFNSGTGWPSFYQPAKKDNIATETDNTLGMARTEVICKHCGAHLGHLFDDAPQTPTHMRYCINSAALKLEEKK